MQSFNDKASQSKPGKVAKEKVMHQLTKTTLCNFFNAGSCPAGADCKFAHGQEELQAKPNFCKTSLCKAWKVGKCKKVAAKCFFAHGYSDIRTTSAFQLQTGNSEDPRKKRAEFWKRFGDTNKSAAASTATTAEGACPDGLELELELHAQAAEGESRAARRSRSRSSSESSESSENGSGSGNSSEQQLDATSSASSSAVPTSSFGDSLRIAWPAPVGNKLRWADVSDDEFSDIPDELPRCDSSLSQASTTVSSFASESITKTSASFEALTTTTLETDDRSMQEESPMAASWQAQPDQQPCVLSIHSMLPVDNGAIRRGGVDQDQLQQQAMMMPYFEGRAAAPMQHRIVMMPVLLPEQYFMQTAAGQGDHVVTASSFEAAPVSYNAMGSGLSLEE
eukprot:TRINITY_DN2969_c0_g1_i11.p1 TRINITY_DN2969_c0_g1~~TRINITY_DN2969_c0_g1_i11.p1  ORF type:complete len:412 (+),score=109.91 TRINITY_DN2969_c0_g1_i11:55-1236(+)